MFVYSILIPIYNEEKNIPILYKRLSDVLSQLKESSEIIFVDDHSIDKSLEMLKGISKNDQKVKIIAFSRNFGHQSAISAGLKYANGDAVILMDGDLQDQPEFIPNLIAAWKQENDIVFTIRKCRKENIFKKAGYFIFYRTLSLIADIKIPLDSGDFCLLDKKVVEAIRMMPERKRFMRGLRSWVGFRQKGLECERDKRTRGKSGYSLKKLIDLAFSGYLSFSSAPLRLASFIGLLFSFVGFLGIIYLLYIKFILGVSLVGWTSIMITILFMGGIQLLTIGIIGEYLSFIFDEVRRRPEYIVRDLVGFDPREDR